MPAIGTRGDAPRAYAPNAAKATPSTFRTAPGLSFRTYVATLKPSSAEPVAAAPAAEGPATAAAPAAAEAEAAAAPAAEEPLPVQASDPSAMEASSAARVRAPPPESPQNIREAGGGVSTVRMTPTMSGSHDRQRVGRLAQPGMGASRSAQQLPSVNGANTMSADELSSSAVAAIEAERRLQVYRRSHRPSAKIVKGLLDSSNWFDSPAAAPPRPKNKPGRVPPPPVALVPLDDSLSGGGEVAEWGEEVAPASYVRPVSTQLGEIIGAPFASLDLPILPNPPSRGQQFRPFSGGASSLGPDADLVPKRLSAEGDRLELPQADAEPAVIWPTFVD